MSAQQEPQTPLHAQPVEPTVLLAKPTATLVLPASTALCMTTSQSHAQQAITVRPKQMSALFALPGQCVLQQTRFRDSAPLEQCLRKEPPTAQDAQLDQLALTMEPSLSVEMDRFPIRMATLVSIAPLVWLALPKCGIRWSCVALATILLTA